jgi:hypothetical protein
LSREPAVIDAVGKEIKLGPPSLAPEVVKAAVEIMDPKEIAALGLSEPAEAKD